MQEYHAHCNFYPLCGVYINTVSAQIGCGEFSLLTLAVSRGVVDLYPLLGINIEHARTTFRKVCGTKY